MTKTNILLIEDDAVLRETTKAFLEGEGFKVQVASDGETGLAVALRGTSALVLLDVMLPGMKGFEVCRLLRDKGCAVPVIMLTGQKVDEIDKVTGLGLGADDYMVKPFGQRELLARINALLRRTQKDVPVLEDFVFGEVRVNFKTKTSTRKGREIVLTAKEYGLLESLVRHEGEVVTRETILNEVWGYETFPTTRTVDTFVHSLRRKIEKKPAKPAHLLTIPWMGYKFKK
jgi:DNA-binding response OmpR family regulator